MLDKYGQVYLTDFGVSDFFQSSSDLLKTGTKGTYLFMAPEMVNPDKSKQIIRGRQADIWAAGVTLFNLLTNEYPFKGKGIIELQKNLLHGSPQLDLLDKKLGAEGK